jgi:hypothetical protein
MLYLASNIEMEANSLSQFIFAMPVNPDVWEYTLVEGLWVTQVGALNRAWSDVVWL